MRPGQRGFTLVELMSVVAIIGILAVVALPIYERYTVRTKMSEVVLALSGCRTPVSEVYLAAGAAPGAGNWGCEGSSTRYVQSVTTDANGKIIATVTGFNDPSIDGKVVTMVPLIGGIPAVSATDMNKQVGSFRCGAPEDGTTLAAKHLPSTCQGR